MSDLGQLADQVRQCRKCRLADTRAMAVPGEGPDKARIMLIGEAPGLHEDQQGRPFVGAAGQFLESLLASVNLSRRDVYIANVIKCRPPSNRDPMPDELVACRSWLDRQIALIRPQIIVTLGRYSMELAYSGVTISRVHGRPKRVDGIWYLPMFHPAAALHQPRYRSMIEEDMLKIPKLLMQVATDSDEQDDRGEPTTPQQLSLL